jgi:hypothetical protein
MGNAAILGLKEELNMESGMKYNTALTIFFVPYIIFEIPSNILLKKMKPHAWCMCGRYRVRYPVYLDRELTGLVQCRCACSASASSWSSRA